MAKLDRILTQDEDLAEDTTDQVITPSTAKKKIRWAIKGEKGYKHILVTPEIAAEMLQYNDRNRPLSKPWVRELARRMTAGRFHDTPKPVIFSSEGRLTDGQHRLYAIIESGKSQHLWVYFGDADKNFFVLGDELTRTGGHIFSINNVKDYNNVAAATRFIVYYDHHWLGGVASATSGSHRLMNEELYEYYKSYSNLEDSIRIGEAFAQSHLATKSLMMAVHYICARKNRRLADEFFLKVATGVGLKSKKEPAAKLHAKLIELSRDASKSKRPTIAALSIKAWNAERDGRETLSKLTYRTESNPDEKFPRAR